MRLTLAAIFLGISTIAFAQDTMTTGDLDKARRAVIEKQGFDKLSIAEKADVDAINVRVDFKRLDGERPIPGRGNLSRIDVVLHPGDPGFDAVLAAAKAAATVQATKAQADLTATGVRKDIKP